MSKPQNPKTAATMEQLASVGVQGAVYNWQTFGNLLPVFMITDVSMRTDVVGVIGDNKDRIFAQVRDIVARKHAKFVTFVGEMYEYSFPKNDDVALPPGGVKNIPGRTERVSVTVFLEDGTTLTRSAPILPDKQLGAWEDDWTKTLDGRFATLWANTKA